MKTLFSLLIFCLTMSNVFAQTETENNDTPDADTKIGAAFRKAELQEIEKYRFDQKFSNHILLKTEYGESVFKNSADVSLVNRVKVTRVELVYTKYPIDESYQKNLQKSLNYKRMETLHKELPLLFDDEEITWVLVAQTEAKSSAESKKLFHGFVLHYVIKPKKK